MRRAAVARRYGFSEWTVYRWISAGCLNRELHDGTVQYAE